MSFLSTDNRAVLSELVKENLTPDMMLFDNVFKDFGNRERGPLIELNKKFLTIMKDIVQNIQKPRKVSFDQQIETHRQNFLSYAPKPPTIPVFADKPSVDNLRNISEIVQDAMETRKYDIATTIAIPKPEMPSLKMLKSTVPKRINIHKEEDSMAPPISEMAITISSEDADHAPPQTTVTLDTWTLFEERMFSRMDAIEQMLTEIKLNMQPSTK